MIRTAARRARPGFTLVELMVAAAICVLIMAVLATAFQLGIDTMRQMKSTGDMMDQLRGATTALQADLQANHLLDANGQPVKLSSLRYDNVTVTNNGAKATPPFTVNSWSPPQNGFFRIGSSTISGTQHPDADQLVNGTGIATNHYLHFTSVLSGLTDDDYYAAAVPAGGKAFQSTAAELAYFLDPNPVGATPGGTPLFRLIRRQRLAAVSDTDRRDRPWPQTFDLAVVSFRPTGGTPPFILNTLADLTNPSNRMGLSVNYVPSGTPADAGFAPIASAARMGDDTLLSNVISFEVQVAWTLSTDPLLSPTNKVPTSSTLATTFQPGSKTDTPFDTLPQVQAANWTGTGLDGSFTYDSWSSQLDWTTNFNPSTANANRPPLLIRVQAVQVRIRIWDPKFQNARQATIVQAL
ncbi:MAG TPA: prepilin-type N-terminal cleavage/methylation domain-containing protein [Urbifossiella sp.]|jgi:type II secretory pathway pseudopilin PulG|nr:prepilin-type N-terminal cleavage/methylation domain-containing protein [Urbifossiella sp.]